MKKKPMSRVLALLLAAVFAVGALPASASYSASFSDVSADAWYADYVSLCATYGIINGYEDGTFRPEADITRAEFMKLLATIGELVPYKAIDTSIHWAAPSPISALPCFPKTSSSSKTTRRPSPTTRRSSPSMSAPSSRPTARAYSPAMRTALSAATTP